VPGPDERAEQRTRWVFGVAAAVVTVFAARFALTGLIEASLYALGHMGTMGEYSPSTLGVAARLILGTGIGAAGLLVVLKVDRDLAAPGFRRAAVATSLLVGALAAGLHHLSHAEFLQQIGAHPPLYEGRYPFEAGGEKVYERFGLRGTAHFDAAGLRRCGPDDGEGPLVTLVGDSMVFGLILDDPDTLCWKLRERFEVRGQKVRWRNAGVPGLSLRSYVENIDVLTTREQTAAVVVGVLIGNDGQVVDLYTRDRLTRHPLYVLAAAVFDPYLPMAVAVAFVKVGRAEGFELVSTVDSLRDLAALAEARKVPTVVFFYDDPQGAHASDNVMHRYVAEALALDEAHTFVHFMGVLTVPAEPEGAYALPDGHPNGPGNEIYADALAPEIAAVLEVPWTP
jgi:hypothetical protein